MSFKKSDKKGKKTSIGSSSSRNTFSGSPPCGSENSAPGMPDGARAKLLELFGQIEQQFEAMHVENAACKFSKS